MSTPAGTVAIHANKKVVAAMDGAGNGRRTTLSMYSHPPTEEITLQQFEAFAMERLGGTLMQHVLASSASPVCVR